MIVELGYPPNFEEIEARFPLKGRAPIFAYGDRIYNPFKVAIGPELFAHEQIHGMRQGDDPAAWWKRYIAEDNFRLAEEVFAHIAEYEYLCERAQDRNHRRRILTYIVRRLADPLYGYLPPLSEERAKKIMKWALREKAKYGAPAWWNAVDKAGKIAANAAV